MINFALRKWQQMFYFFLSRTKSKVTHASPLKGEPIRCVHLSEHWIVTTANSCQYILQTLQKMEAVFHSCVHCPAISLQPFQSCLSLDFQHESLFFFFSNKGINADNFFPKTLFSWQITEHIPFLKTSVCVCQLNPHPFKLYFPFCTKH